MGAGVGRDRARVEIGPHGNGDLAPGTEGHETPLRWRFECGRMQRCFMAEAPSLEIGSASARPLNGLVIQDSLSAPYASSVPVPGNCLVSARKRPRSGCALGASVTEGRHSSCAKAHGIVAMHIDISCNFFCLPAATAMEAGLTAAFSSINRCHPARGNVSPIPGIFRP